MALPLTTSGFFMSEIQTKSTSLLKTILATLISDNQNRLLWLA